MNSRQADYRKRRQAQGLVQLNLWVRPEHRDAIRSYAAELAASVTSDAPEPENDDRTVASDALGEKIDATFGPVPSSVEELLAHKEKAKAERARKRAAEKKARVTSDKPETKPIPRRINDNPAQLRRVMQYHHPDKNNPGADIALYRRAKNHLKALRTRERGLYWSNIERKWMKEPNDGRNPSSDREARP